VKRPPSPESALNGLVREARREQTEALDFARIEERLLLEVRRAPPQASRSTRAWAWASVAVAACALLWLVKGRAPVNVTETRAAIVDASAALDRDGDALAVGTRVTAAEREVTVTHAGRARWKLEPSSSALLAEKGERITVRLEHGGVLSEVVRSPKPETFVVEAGAARVAVHGTVFRVSLEGDRLKVQVREGVVAVGPREGAAVFLLEAPASGDFSTDGRTGSVNGRPSATSSRPGEPLKPGRLRAATGPSAQGSVAAPSPSVALPAEPSINDIEIGISRSVDIASDCFRRHTQSTDGILVTARTALSLQITSEGAATDVRFQPPLSPDVEACAAAGIASVTFAPSEQGAKVTRLLELKR
jgi:hypothetical protein